MTRMTLGAMTALTLAFSPAFAPAFAEDEGKNPITAAFEPAAKKGDDQAG